MRATLLMPPLFAAPHAPRLMRLYDARCAHDARFDVSLLMLLRHIRHAMRDIINITIILMAQMPMRLFIVLTTR